MYCSFDMDGLNSEHLATGSRTPPEVPDGKVRVYGMRHCPYVHRVLLALQFKRIPTEVININLSKKPQWYFEKNTLGKVPTIEHDGKLIIDSTICVDYLDGTFRSDRSLVPEDPYERAKQKMLTERLYDSLAPALYNYERNLQDAAAIERMDDAFGVYESLLHQDYFGGNALGYADIMSWPWIERLSSVEILSNGRLAVTKDKYPKFAEYIERMRSLPEVKAILLDGAVHASFIRHYLSGTYYYDDFP